MQINYLKGQKATSSTVSSCPQKIPRGPTDGTSALLSLPSPDLALCLIIDPPDLESLAADVIWS